MIYVTRNATRAVKCCVTTLLMVREFVELPFYYGWSSLSSTSKQQRGSWGKRHKHVKIRTLEKSSPSKTAFPIHL